MMLAFKSGGCAALRAVRCASILGRAGGWAGVLLADGGWVRGKVGGEEMVFSFFQIFFSPASGTSEDFF